MFKRYFLTGLLVLVPLAITIWVITSLIHFLDQTLIWLPYDYQPRNLFGFDIPGLGVVLTLAVILGIGLLEVVPLIKQSSFDILIAILIRLLF